MVGTDAEALPEAGPPAPVEKIDHEEAQKEEEEEDEEKEEEKETERVPRTNGITLLGAAANVIDILDEDDLDNESLEPLLQVDKAAENALGPSGVEAVNIYFEPELLEDMNAARVVEDARSLLCHVSQLLRLSADEHNLVRSHAEHSQAYSPVSVQIHMSKGDCIGNLFSE